MDLPEKLSRELSSQQKNSLWVRTNKIRQNYPDILIALGLTLICSFTRYLALPASLWEWDDMLFARALHRFDLTQHIPHPPGFPVFVMMSRAVNFLINQDQLALTLLSLFFSSLLGAALYYFYYELLKDRWIAVSGALLGIFAPNVWVFSGAGRSDAVGLCLGMIGLTLILKGRSLDGLFLGACALLGIGMGVRVTLLPIMGLMVIAVSLGRLYHKEWKIVFSGALISFLGFLSWYLPVIVHTTLPAYREATRLHTNFWLATDTIVSSGENGVLTYRLSRFFLDVWGDWNIAIAVYVIGTIGLFCLILLRQWQKIVWGTLCFVPFIIFTISLNTPLSAPFYSLPYIPLFTGLVACGLTIPCRFLLQRWKSFQHFGFILVIASVLGLINWSYPLVKILHSEASPPIQATRSLVEKIDKVKDKLYFEGLFMPHVFFFLENYQTEMWMKDEPISLNLINPTNGNFQHFYLLSSVATPGSVSEHFRWSPGRGERRLKTLSMGRYFDAYVTDLSHVRNVSFTSGWYLAESSGAEHWRWMGKHGMLALFNESDEMILHLRGRGVQVGSSHQIPPTIIIKLDGREIDRITGSDINLTRTIKTTPGKYWSALTIETTQAIVPKLIGAGADDRELGFQCYEAEWYRAENQSLHIFTSDQFVGEGWFPLEVMKPRSWRWAGVKSTLHLPVIDGDGQLSIMMQVPEQANGKRAKITVQVSGQVVETFQAEPGILTKTFRVPATIHKNSPCDLILITDGYATSTSDTRKLGINVSSLTWLPVAVNKD